MAETARMRKFIEKISACISAARLFPGFARGSTRATVPVV
jgi:hypothetical protein